MGSNPKVALKIKQTRASIDALKRQAEGVARQIEIQEIKLAAFLELEESIPAHPHKSKAAKKPTKPAVLKDELPWDRILPAIRQAVGDKEFGTADIYAQLGLMKKEAAPSTVRSKLGRLVRTKMVIRIEDGRYRFAPVSKKEAA
jgi:hypothetical protein